MKKDVTEILYSLEAEDLGPLLDKKYGKDLNNQNKAALYEKAALKTGAETKTRRKPRLIAAVIAAVFVISLAFGIYAYALDVKEYNEAVSYFSSIDYPTEGMSRGEIKRLYRTIITAPADLSDKGEKDAYAVITGIDINSISVQSDENTGTWYELSTVDKYGKPCLQYLIKHDGEDAVWTFGGDGISVNNYCPADGGVIVCGGVTKDTPKKNRSYQFFALLDDNGQTVWQTVDEPESEASYYSAYAVAMLKREDGTFLALGDFVTGEGENITSVFTLTGIASDGSVISRKEIPTNDMFEGVRFAFAGDSMPFGGGFISHLTAGIDIGYVMISADGTLSDVFAFAEDGYDYEIVDMIAHEGKLYLSVDAVRELQGSNKPSNYDSRRVFLLSTLLKKLISPSSALYHSYFCTDILKENCDALLIVCDPDSDMPYTYYKESGAMADVLGRDEEGRLIWKTKSIDYGVTYYKRYDSNPSGKMLQVYGGYTEYKYTFDKDGRSAVKVNLGTHTGGYKY